MTPSDEAHAVESYSALWADLYERITRPLDEHTKVQLLWRHYADSLYFASVGDTTAALRTVTAGLALNPQARELVRLRAALDDAEPGDRLDVAPYTVR
jgi:hypothetical protein